MPPDSVPPRGSMLPLFSQFHLDGPTGEEAERLRHTLLYLADMAAEMEVIAAGSGCATLAGLFGLAQREAALQTAAASAANISSDPER